VARAMTAPPDTFAVGHFWVDPERLLHNMDRLRSLRFPSVSVRVVPSFSTSSTALLTRESALSISCSCLASAPFPDCT
jgi:hypothetical protein